MLGKIANRSGIIAGRLVSQSSTAVADFRAEFEVADKALSREVFMQFIRGSFERLALGSCP